jgi:hypothetical protein
MKGIVVEADDDSALVEQVDEKGERTGEFYELDYVEMKLRTFVVMEKADDTMDKGAVVSWDTSNGKYYGDIVDVVTDGMARGEPQGLEIEGSEENPAYVIRVWMMEEGEASEEEPEDEPAEDDGEKAAKQPQKAKSMGEWTPTNVTVVARGDGLTVEEALPTDSAEDDYDSEEEEDEETAMKSIDPEFSALVKRAMQENAEVLRRLAEFDSEEKGDAIPEAVEQEVVAVEEVAVEETKSEEVVVDEAKAEEVVASAEETSSDTEIVADETSEEVKSEEVAVEEVVVEDAATEEVVVEEKASISFDELKEFHNLLKEVTKQ